jgi:hypothetical protein
VGWLLVGASWANPSSAVAAGPDSPDVPDLADVALTLGDLPAGFVVSQDTAQSFFDLSHSLAASLASPTARDVNPTVFERRQESEAEFVVALLTSPLSATDETMIDAALLDPGAPSQVADRVGGASVVVLDAVRIGEVRLAVRLTSADLGITMDFVLARRGPVLEFVGHAWPDGTNPRTSLGQLARTLDVRVARVTGVAAPIYRPAGPLVPELTTHIPTPLDVSTDPAVVGTNIVLAAIATLLLTISSKLATRMLSEHEAFLTSRLPMIGALGRLEARVGELARRRITRQGVQDSLRLALIASFYGVVFSLLEPGWQPLSVTGLWLLGSFTIACGIVGIADDLVQWRMARAWGLPADLGVRPTNALLAVASTGISRIAVVVPGLMFGAPEALRLDEAALDLTRARRLTMAGFLVLVAVGGGSWLATIATSAAAGTSGTAPLLDGIGAFLLLVFAATVQNLFVALLGLTGTAGGLVRRWHPGAWIGALLVVTFVFWHTLVNPTGDATLAMTTRNVQVALGLVGAFTTFVVVAWALLLILHSRASSPVVVAAGQPPRALAATLVEPSGSPALVAVSPVVSPTTPTADAWSTSAGGRRAPNQVDAATPGVAALASPIGSPEPGAVELSLATAGGSARGRAWVRVSGSTVSTITTLIDPRAIRQLRFYAVMSVLALVSAAVIYLIFRGGRVTDAAAGAFCGLLLVWVLTLIGGRLWLEGHRIVHRASFAGLAVAGVDVGRDWSLGCLLAILLTPLVALLYLLLARRRIVTFTAPLAADRIGLVCLRLKASEAEGRLLAQLILAARTAA